MASPNADPHDPPLDPAAERVRRKLARFMVINLAILFVAVMAVVVALVYRSGRNEEARPPAVSELPVPPAGSVLSGEIALPAGARLLSHALSGNRLTLDVEQGGERIILIYDIGEGRVIGRFTIVSP